MRTDRRRRPLLIAIAPVQKLPVETNEDLPAVLPRAAVHNRRLRLNEDVADTFPPLDGFADTKSQGDAVDVIVEVAGWRRRPKLTAGLPVSRL